MPVITAATIPWGSNFRIVLRKGELRIIWPSEPDGFSPDDCSCRSRMAASAWRGRGWPGTRAFDTIVNGEAWRANVSGCDLLR